MSVENTHGEDTTGELRELVEQWREKAEQKYGVGGLLCADELEERL